VIKVCDLPYGWSLMADGTTEFGVTPIFLRQGGGVKTWKGPDLLSRTGEAFQAREIYRDRKSVV